jgi:hypothetical protein
MKPALVGAAAAVVLLAGCSSSAGNSGTPASTSATTTAPARPTVAAAALDGLLLSPAEIGGAVGAPEVPVNKTETQLLDSSNARPDKGCRFTQPAEASVYTGTGWNGVRQQDLQEPGEDFKHHVIQAVVSFPSANDATRFFTASAQLWVPCANHQYRVVSPGKPDLTFVIGPVANTNGTLSTVDTLTGGKKWACQRALTVSNNIAVDVVACSADSPPDAALNIAHQIAAKVDKQ